MLYFKHSWLVRLNTVPLTQIPFQQMYKKQTHCKYYIRMYASIFSAIKKPPTYLYQKRKFCKTTHKQYFNFKCWKCHVKEIISQYISQQGLVRVIHLCVAIYKKNTKWNKKLREMNVTGVWETKIVRGNVKGLSGLEIFWDVV